jgi:hypothetical protein
VTDEENVRPQLLFHASSLILHHQPASFDPETQAMSQWAERVQPLVFAAAAAVIGAVLLAVGIGNGDTLLAGAGAAALLGSALLVAVTFRILPGFTNAPRRTRGAKFKYFWLPPEDGAPPPPATDVQIFDIEKKIGHALPRTYIRVLRMQNGGELRYTKWVSQAPEKTGIDSFDIPDLSGVGPDDCLAQTPAMIREGLLPRGVACIFEGQEWDLCLDYRRVPAGGQPRVVAFDEERNEYVLTDSMDVFFRALTRALPEHVYAAQGTIGRHSDTQLLNLSEGLGVSLAPAGAGAKEYRADIEAWASSASPDEAAVLRLVRNGCDRDHEFPETWSKWLLCCDIAPEYRPELERKLQATDFQWVLLHEPAP